MEGGGEGRILLFFLKKITRKELVKVYMKKEAKNIIILEIIIQEKNFKFIQKKNCVSYT